jgi:truncated hemoglobin YjbI
MHWYVQFRDPVPDPDQAPTIFEWAGGLPALLRMTRLFYEKYVPQDPLLAPLFASMSADHPQRVAMWLAEVFCGPANYSSQYGGYTRMISQHLGKCLTEEQRARWVTLLLLSAKDAGLPNDPEFRSAFDSYIAWGSRLAVENSQTDAKPPAHMPMPRWAWYTAARIPDIGPRSSGPGRRHRDCGTRPGRTRELHPAHQAPVPGRRQAVDELRLRPVVPRRRQPSRRRYPRPDPGRHDALRRRLAISEDRYSPAMGRHRQSALRTHRPTQCPRAVRDL